MHMCMHICILQIYLYDCRMMIEPQAVSAFAAIAHADRIKAYRLLVTTGPSGLPSGEVARRLSIPPTRMSFHLSTLERAGLVCSWREGRTIRYAARYEAMRQLLAFLTEDCCDGHPEICGDLAALASACE